MVETGDPRATFRRGFAASLRQLRLALELIAEDVVGEEDARIDWIAAGPDGRAWIVLLEHGRADATLLERGLVQRAWVEARVADWRQLAPSLALRDGLTPGVLLVAAEHDRSTRVAAREAGDAIRVVRWEGDPERPVLAVLEPPPRARQKPSHAAPQLRSVFRTGLTDADLAS
jgi:hypothetical protein